MAKLISKSYWITKLGGQEALDKALQDGVIEPAAAACWQQHLTVLMLLMQRLKLLLLKKAARQNWYFIQKYPWVHGKEANNPWLQEMPDPITKATWDNYALFLSDGQGTGY